MEERSEPLFPVVPRSVTYSFESAVRGIPALCPDRVVFDRVPLGQLPFLHHLLGRLLGVVRRLQRYYGAVRLPTTVHHRRTSLDFPMRPASSTQTVVGSPGSQVRC